MFVDGGTEVFDGGRRMRTKGFEPDAIYTRPRASLLGEIHLGQVPCRL
jgi:hypothetical protein